MRDRLLPYVTCLAQTFAHRAALKGMLSCTNMELPVFESSCTVKGELPPWETAKAFALHTVIKTFSEQLDEPASKLLGKPLAEYIAEHVTMQGGLKSQFGDRNMVTLPKQQMLFKSDKAHIPWRLTIRDRVLWTGTQAPRVLFGVCFLGVINYVDHCTVVVVIH